MNESQKDNPRSGISVDFNAPADIPTSPFEKLGIRKTWIVVEDHYVGEDNMSPIPKGKRLRVSMEIPGGRNEKEIPRLIQETNERIYTILKGNEETSFVDDAKDDPDKRWRYFISLPIPTRIFDDYGKGYGKKVMGAEGMEGIFIAGGCNTLLCIRAESLKKLYELTRHIMQDVLTSNSEVCKNA
jgi:hypothetical protein